MDSSFSNIPHPVPQPVRHSLRTLIRASSGRGPFISILFLTILSLPICLGSEGIDSPYPSAKVHPLIQFAAKSAEEHNGIILEFLKEGTFSDQLRVLEGILQREDPGVEALVSQVLNSSSMTEAEKSAWLRRFLLGISSMQPERHDRWIQANQAVLRELTAKAVSMNSDSLKAALQRELPPIYPNRYQSWTALLAQDYLERWRDEKRLVRGDERLWAAEFLRITDPSSKDSPANGEVVLPLLRLQVIRHLPLSMQP